MVLVYFSESGTFSIPRFWFGYLLVIHHYTSITDKIQNVLKKGSEIFIISWERLLNTQFLLDIKRTFSCHFSA